MAAKISPNFRGFVFLVDLHRFQLQPSQRIINFTYFPILESHNEYIIAKMAEGSGGIDRKAEERMEFSTSKEVTVHPTFESMSLKGLLVRPV